MSPSLAGVLAFAGCDRTSSRPRPGSWSRWTFRSAPGVVDGFALRYERRLDRSRSRPAPPSSIAPGFRPSTSASTRRSRRGPGHLPARPTARTRSRSWRTRRRPDAGRPCCPGLARGSANASPGRRCGALTAPIPHRCPHRRTIKDPSDVPRRR